MIIRKLFVAGNWKMNTTGREAVELARAIAQGAPAEGVDLAVCPPFVYLDSVIKVLDGSAIAVGAQNAHFEPKGAFTGETSLNMLKDIGCHYVILGHSERRHVFGESDELIAAKVTAALESGLDPILCVGETLDEREAGQTLAVVGRQVRSALSGVDNDRIKRVTIAYEPVWAIGTGKTATPEQAQEVHAEIRGLAAQLYNDATANALRIQYGGSVKPENAREIFAQPDIDGGLIGGASLKADSFLAIARAGLSVIND